MPDSDRSSTLTSRSKYLTKSLFTLAVDCPTKLFYSQNPEYGNRKRQDSFLQCLANGGLQVGQLARVMHPYGVAVTGDSIAEQVRQTSELLEREEVTIFEAAVEDDGLLARIDILRKRGVEVELIEVKAKSWNPSEDALLKKRGGIAAEFQSYVLDLAYQVFVFQRSYPRLNVSSYLMLPDTGTRTSVDGLNRKFKVCRDGTSARVEVAIGTDVNAIGASILRLVEADKAVQSILEEGIEISGATEPFTNAVSILRDAMRSERRISTTPHANCGKCEFRSEHPVSSSQLSGFHECWKEAFGWSDEDFQEGTVLDLWNSRSKDALIAEGIRKLSDVRRDHLKVEPGKLGLSHGQRQWMQVSGEWEGGGPLFLDRERMGLAISTWQYPLHFIDFETAAVALPYFTGQRPYGQLAFQFSHHVMHHDGRIEHRSQFLHRTVGTYPNIEFLRELKSALTEQGTVFRWATHENTILRDLRRQVLESDAAPQDLNELVEFIDSLTYSNESEGGGRVTGARCMVDLKEIAERYFFHPATRGSSSLKKVLPAVFESSDELKSIYSQPIYGVNAQIRSRNFVEPMTWWQPGNPVLDPYSLLPPIFDDVSPEEIAALEFNLDAELADGIAATIAYMRLQSEIMPTDTRLRIEKALLRYCELDTLAMVMVVQAWQGWLRASSN